jgi:hypothetical protein
MRRFVAAILGFALTISLTPAQEQPANTTPQRPGPLLGRPSPPQPTQRQGLDYFVGAWAFRWTGRESPLTAGPRTGTVSYTRLGETNFLEAKTEGRSDAAGAYKESGVIGWHETQKVLAVHERLPSGVELLSVGDWTSPIAIRLESAPVTIKGETVRLRRTIGIVSSHSFTMNEELSTNGGPFVRLGGGVFTKK